MTFREKVSTKRPGDAERYFSKKIIKMTAGSSEKEKADPELVEKIIHTLKSKGCFDQFRKEFIAEADTKVYVFSFRDIEIYCIRSRELH